MSVNDYLTRDIRLKHLRMLVAIEEAGRLTRAAQLLHVTQPALAKALAEIERAGAELRRPATKGACAS